MSMIVWKMPFKIDPFVDIFTVYFSLILSLVYLNIQYMTHIQYMCDMTSKCIFIQHWVWENQEIEVTCLCFGAFITNSPPSYILELAGHDLHLKENFGIFLIL